MTWVASLISTNVLHFPRRIATVGLSVFEASSTAWSLNEMRSGEVLKFSDKNGPHRGGVSQNFVGICAKVHIHNTKLVTSYRNSAYRQHL